MRLATSEGGAKHEQTEQEDNFYDCLDEMVEETEQDMNMYDCLSEDDEEDEEMEPAPTRRNPIKELIVEMNNEEKQARNENRRRARAGRRRKRKERQVIKETDKVIQETKAALNDVKEAAKSKERTTQPRRSPRLNPTETAGSASESMNLGANMHSTQTVTDLGQELPRQPYEPLPDMQLPRMFPPMALKTDI